MKVVRVPTPLRPYTGGVKEVEVSGTTVAAVIGDLTRRYPDLRRHLFDDQGALRPFVNIFINESDVRNLQGDATPVDDGDRLMIIPSIAGGAPGAPLPLRPVDHSALRTNQAVIIGLLLAAYVANAAWLVALVGLIMLIGTALGRPGFVSVYRGLRSARLIRPDVLKDNPEPHRFAQGFGGAVLAAGVAAFLAGMTTFGWALSWLVVALAALNLFAGFCAGCAVYYWMHRIGLRWFAASPPPNTFPGQRPSARQS
jgi:molybdopterin converting factor small subunit